MNPTQERKLALFLLLIVLVINGVALSAELSMGAVNGTDNVSHWALLQGMVHTIETGGNPLDFWSGEGSFGAATMRTYQPLAHALVALLYFALGKTVPLMTVFLWVRYLAIVLLPLAFFIAAGDAGAAAHDRPRRRGPGSADLHQRSLRPGLQQLRFDGTRALSTIGGRDPAAARHRLRLSRACATAGRG